MTKKWDLEISNAEKEPKIRIYVKNWVRWVLLKIFDFGQSQRKTVKSKSTARSTARVLTWLCDITPKANVVVRKRSMHVEVREGYVLVREARVREWRQVSARGGT